MLDVRIPDLTFPELKYSKKETPWDLRRLLYKGGAGTHVKAVGALIDAGSLGSPLVERIELVERIHEVIEDFLGRGGSRETASTKIEKLISFFRWADGCGVRLNLESVEVNYLFWAESLLLRVRVGKGLSERTAYGNAAVLGWILDRVLGRSKPIVTMTHMRRRKRGTRAVSIATDKQNLEETFTYGHFLLDISDGLSLDAIWGSLPVCIPLRNGKVLEYWAGFKRPGTGKKPNSKHLPQAKFNDKRSAKKRAAWEADRTMRTRWQLVNLRIQAEMFMLMAQPAVNLAQAHKLRMDQWSYKPSIHGYEVRSYKHRRFGAVVFEIYSEYRQIFDRYIKWRAAIFPDDPDGLLFPLIKQGRREDRRPNFGALKERCKCAGVKYMPPSALRNTNVNWMLRRTGDPNLTADEKQHSTKTLIGAYEKPSQQRAMVQVKAFWARNDPALVAAGPGNCAGNAPEPIPSIPANATKPDCKTPAGCLFCCHQRDIDSQDHVWSLVSYRLLKSFELAEHRQPESTKELPRHPAELAIERLTSKIAFILESSATRAAWVKEALLRIQEGRYHPDWAELISGEQAEGGNSEP